MLDIISDTRLWLFTNYGKHHIHNVYTSFVYILQVRSQGNAGRSIFRHQKPIFRRNVYRG